MIEIVVNNNTLRFDQAPSLHELLSQHTVAAAGQPYAVALNGEFVPKTHYANTPLNHGDTLDIVSPVGGG